MRQITIFLAVTALLVSSLGEPVTLSAQSQAPSKPDLSDWQNVTGLRPGVLVAVETGRRFPAHCYFSEADDSGLACSARPMWVQWHQFEFSRSQIESVELRHDRRNLWIGIGIGAGIGGGLGAWRSGNTNPHARVGLGLAGATFGGLVAVPFAAIASRLIPGKTIYMRGRQSSASRYAPVGP